MIRGLQERAARAQPAERVEYAGGWWLRSAPGCAWWVETVLPHGGAGDIEARVAEAERFSGATTRFQMTPGVCADVLDELLADRGYRSESPVSLQVALTNDVREGLHGKATVEVDDRPTPEWFDAWHGVAGGDPQAEWALLGRIDRPSGYVRATVDGTVVGVSRVVTDTGWAGVFAMATLPEARGRGVARSVLAATARWAGSQGAERMYLQVERTNIAARTLYARFGFSEVCTYHYRIRQQPEAEAADSAAARTPSEGVPPRRS